MFQPDPFSPRALNYLLGIARHDLERKRLNVTRFQPRPDQSEEDAARVLAEFQAHVAFRAQVVDWLEARLQEAQQALAPDPAALERSILIVLYDGPKTRQDITQALLQTARAVNPALERLERSGFLHNYAPYQSDFYSLTYSGHERARQILQEFRHAL